MTESNRSEFIAMLSATLDLYGRKLSVGAYSIWFEALLNHPIEDCRRALAAYVQAGGDRAPVPVDVIRILQANDGWIGAEEAWSIVSKALSDESVTVFWTLPMQMAFGVALEISSDKVASRMAFKEVYTRELTMARDREDKPVWQASPGTNAQARQAAIEDALRLGRVTVAYAQKLLPHLEQPADLAALGLNVKALNEDAAA